MTAKRTPAAKLASKTAARKRVPARMKDPLFDRVAGILDQARRNVVRAVNSQMVHAYWLIGREIVQEVQGGKGRAAYGVALLADLSGKLTARYGSGFSETTLQYFRKFYQVYLDLCPQCPLPPGVESAQPHAISAIPRPVGVEFITTSSTNSNPTGSELLTGFSPQLSWSHYRALMRVEKAEAREFYEREAIAGGWDKRTLERQIHSFYYDRLLTSQHPETMRPGVDDRYVDLVFYHCHLRFYLLIDLKLGELTHGDVGQMDGYVRMFDDLVASDDDNPSIGLILCSENNETVVKYSVLKDRKQIFASKYMLYLPTEDELRREIERERKLIEANTTGERD